MRGKGLRVLSEIPSLGRIKEKHRPAEVLGEVAICRVIPVPQPGHPAIGKKGINGIVPARVSVSCRVFRPLDHLKQAASIGQHVPWKGRWCERGDQIASPRSPANCWLAGGERQKAILRAGRGAVVVGQNVSIKSSHQSDPAVVVDDIPRMIVSHQLRAVAFSPTSATNSCPRAATLRASAPCQRSSRA